MSTLVEHAQRELRLTGQFEEDPAYAQSIVAAVAAFASYGHSGGSAGAAIGVLERLLRHEALAPLTSDPDEWEDRSEMSGRPWWQNRRDSRAMSHDGGQTWWYVGARHPGERCVNGDELGALVRCPGCSGDGVLHEPEAPRGPGPEPLGERAAGTGV